jgi:hypothetical protein
MHITSILAAGAAVVAIVAAPAAIASAAVPTQGCTPDGSGTVCQSPGNVQITDTPPPVTFDPYGDYGLAIGGFGGGYGGGFHGGGGGHR